MADSYLNLQYILPHTPILLQLTCIVYYYLLYYATTYLYSFITCSTIVVLYYYYYLLYTYNSCCSILFFMVSKCTKLLIYITLKDGDGRLLGSRAPRATCGVPLELSGPRHSREPAGPHARALGAKNWFFGYPTMLRSLVIQWNFAFLVTLQC